MPSSHSLAGLMKWLTREPWRDAFADVLEQHVAGPCEAADIASIEELGERVGAHWAMTLWGCAFEDFLTREVEDAGNIVDDYLKRRGWKENAVDRAYMAALRSSTMSLYEVSDIQPGQSFLARDLLRGGEPIRVTEHTATKTIKPWDRLAMRIVEVRGKTVIGGGLLPFEHQLADKLIGTFAGTKKRIAKDAPAFFDELGVDTGDPEVEPPDHIRDERHRDSPGLGALVLLTLSGRPARPRPGSQAPAAGQQRRRGDGVHRARLPAEERCDAGEDSSSPRSGA